MVGGAVVGGAVVGRASLVIDALQRARGHSVTACATGRAPAKGKRIATQAAASHRV